MSFQMGPRVLVIKAKGGFGNRILSAATGIVLAELTHRVPVIDWRDGMYLPVGVNAYPLLFEPQHTITAEELDARTDVAPTIWSGRLAEHPVHMVDRFYPNSHSSPFVYRKLSINPKHPVVPQDVAVFWSYLPKFARLPAQFRGSTRSRRSSPEAVVREVLSTHFRPNTRVRATVAELFRNRNRPIIGVHIRYTDRRAPLDRIVEEMRRLRRRIPQASIFLATDNGDVQAQISATFDNLFVIEKRLGNTASALHVDVDSADPLGEAENALIDMWALSSCDWLIHSQHSTFSVAAALIGAIPADRQIDVDRHNPRVVLKRWFQAYA